MKKFTHLTLSFILSTQMAFGQTGQGNPKTIKHNYKKTLIDAYVNAYTKRFIRTINDYNDNVKNANVFIDKYVKDKKDQQTLKKIAKTVKTLPKFKNKNGVYMAKTGEGRVSFDIVSAQQGYIFINGKKYDVKTGKSLEDKIKNLTLFIAKNKTQSSAFPNVMDLFFPRAEAFICGGICVTALIGGVAILGTMTYKMAKGSLFGDENSFEDLSEMRKYIQDKTRECNNHYNEAEQYDGSAKRYRKAPGAFKTFGLLTKFLDEDHKLNETKLRNHLYKELGNEEISSCQEFARKLQENNSVFGRRNTAYEMAMSATTIEQQVCKEQKKLIECLEDYNQLHQSHRDRDGSGKINVNIDLYDAGTGVYQESDQFQDDSK